MDEQSAAGIQVLETRRQSKSVHTRMPKSQASLCQAVEFVPFGAGLLQLQHSRSAHFARISYEKKHASSQSRNGRASPTPLGEAAGIQKYAKGKS
jgi:hypothetical protein